MFADVFIKRPVLSTVCSLLIILAGAIAIPTLPIARYPELAPPAVSVTAFYTGANAQTVESAVTTPLEQAINGVEGMTYMTSSSTNSGVSTISVTFDISRDQDLAAVDVQNRVNSALGRMPVDVRHERHHRLEGDRRLHGRAGLLQQGQPLHQPVHQQLPGLVRPRRDQARARRRRRDHLRRTPLRDAAVAGSQPAGGAQAHRR